MGRLAVFSYASCSGEGYSQMIYDSVNNNEDPSLVININCPDFEAMSYQITHFYCIISFDRDGNFVADVASDVIEGRHPQKVP